ncbi:MAG: glutamate--tRNA ligase [Alphaproteobacteria bacterium]
MSSKGPVIVRFAPSPTGFLHIGSARTALFNWLYAKHTKGKMLLRIEDTDRARSTPESVQTILEGMTWLGLDWEGEAISQFDRFQRHADVAKQMVANGTAYYCYATTEELDAMRAEQKAKGLPQRYDGRWRDRPASDAPPDGKPVIRLKAPQSGETTVDDQVMGSITVQNTQLDDMVLLRADGTPTYMHAVVVDDYDMGITHVIRGDDHMTNTFRQVQIYKAMGWPIPTFAHLPMILGPDGAKLSKRHGAPAVADYRERGYLPEAIRNYLLRLCWAHGDDEIISLEQAIEWFDFDGIGKSPARFDFVKLGSINAHYIKLSDDNRLAELAKVFLERTLSRTLTGSEGELLVRAMPDLKPRAQTIVEIAEQAVFYFHKGALPLDDKAKKLITPESTQHLKILATQMQGLDNFTSEKIEGLFRTYAEEKTLKLGSLAQPLRAVLTGSTVSPPIFGVAALLGKTEALSRIQAHISD